MELVAFLGIAGAGKTDQGKLLRDKFGFSYFSTSDLIRAEKLKDTPEGALCRNLQKREFLADMPMSKLVKEHLQNSGGDIYVSDGFPRTVPQAIYLEDTLIKELGINKVTRLWINNVPYSVAEERMIRRGRPDDNPEDIAKSFRIYSADTLPILDYYASKGIDVAFVDGIGTVDEVHSRILSALK